MTLKRRHPAAHNLDQNRADSEESEKSSIHDVFIFFSKVNKASYQWYLLNDLALWFPTPEDFESLQ